MPDEIKYIEVAQLLGVSNRTAIRRLKEMRKSLGIAPYTRLTRQQVYGYFFAEGT